MVFLFTPGKSASSFLKRQPPNHFFTASGIPSWRRWMGTSRTWDISSRSWPAQEAKPKKKSLEISCLNPPKNRKNSRRGMFLFLFFFAKEEGSSLLSSSFWRKRIISGRLERLPQRWRADPWCEVGGAWVGRALYPAGFIRDYQGFFQVFCGFLGGS